jgi:hypothetical protein
MHSEPNGAISSNKSETFFDFQNFYGSRLYLTSGQLIINAFLILLVIYFVKLYALNFGKIGFWLHIWEFYVVTNFRKKKSELLLVDLGGPK